MFNVHLGHYTSRKLSNFQKKSNGDISGQFQWLTNVPFGCMFFTENCCFFSEYSPNNKYGKEAILFRIHLKEKLFSEKYITSFIHLGI